jgi:hypothetical protein
MQTASGAASDHGRNPEHRLTMLEATRELHPCGEPDRPDKRSSRCRWISGAPCPDALGPPLMARCIIRVWASARHEILAGRPTNAAGDWSSCAPGSRVTSRRSPARLASCSPPSLSSRLPNPATSPSRALLNRRPSYIKLIKRCGYGRSGFDLLRIRVLLAS